MRFRGKIRALNEMNSYGNWLKEKRLKKCLIIQTKKR